MSGVFDGSFARRVKAWQRMINYSITNDQYTSQLGLCIRHYHCELIIEYLSCICIYNCLYTSSHRIVNRRPDSFPEPRRGELACVLADHVRVKGHRGESPDGICQ